MPGYWDGARRMVVRFAPTDAGDWDYRVTSNVRGIGWQDRQFHGGRLAVARLHPSGERASLGVLGARRRGLYQAHLWMGATSCVSPPWTKPRSALLPMRAPRRSSITCAGSWAAAGAAAAYQRRRTRRTWTWFRRLDERIRYLNDKGIIADLMLAGGGNGTLTRLFPTWEQRRRFVRYLVARYAAMNVTWQGVEQFEDYPDAPRAAERDRRGALKKLDPYQHPRSTGARVTSAPLLDDGWMDFVSYGTPTIRWAPSSTSSTCRSDLDSA